MSSLFNKRKLSNLYTNIDAVKESSAIKTADGYLKLKVGMGFGEHGRMMRHKSIKLSATDLLVLTRGIKEHEASILDVIDMLEDAQKWIAACHANQVKYGFHTATTFDENQEFIAQRADIFSRVLAEESPLMVHGVAKGRKLKLQFYCEGLKDMEIRYDARNQDQIRMMKGRMDELITAFRNHLVDIDNLNYVEVMEGIVA